MFFKPSSRSRLVQLQLIDRNERLVFEHSPIDHDGGLRVLRPPRKAGIGARRTQTDRRWI